MSNLFTWAKNTISRFKLLICVLFVTSCYVIMYLYIAFTTYTGWVKKKQNKKRNH